MIKKIAICCFIFSITGGCSPYGNMGTRERFEFSDKLKRNPGLQSAVDSSFGKWQLVGGRGTPVPIQRPVMNNKTPMNNENLPFGGATPEQIKQIIKVVETENGKGELTSQSP